MIKKKNNKKVHALTSNKNQHLNKPFIAKVDHILFQTVMQWG